MDDTPEQILPDQEPAARRWIKRLGVAGFMFFLVKGLLWLLVPAGIVLWRSLCGV